MAWWEALDNPALKETQGVLLWAGGLAVAMLAAGLGLAYAWHWWKDGQKKRRAAASKR